MPPDAWLSGAALPPPTACDYAFLIFIIFALSITTSLQSLQRQEMFNAGCMLRLIEFGSTEPIEENCPGCFSFLSRQIIPRPANENPLSIDALHFGHLSSCHTISENFVLVTVFDLLILLTVTMRTSEIATVTAKTTTTATIVKSVRSMIYAKLCLAVHL